MKTATQMIDRIDLRRARAMSMASVIMKAIDPYLDQQLDRVRRDAFDAIFEIVWQEGVEVLTDPTRAETGLPPRGPDGWTDDEIRALEAARFAVINRPITMRLADLGKS